MKALRIYLKLLCMVCLSLFCLACVGEKGKDIPLCEGDTLSIRHARLFQIVEYDEYTRVILRNPWDTTRVLHTYNLIPDSSSLTKNELPQGTILRIPLMRTVISSSVHCSLIDELGAFSSIAGVCDLKFIRSQKIHEAYQKGLIQNIGNGVAPDVEKILDLRADVLFVSPYEGNNGYGRLTLLGIPLIECADYMEVSPLGRAEWMRFYGRLFGRKIEADSLFSEIERNYVRLAKKVAGKNERPTLFCDLPMMSSVWHVPGGKSTIGKLYTDAGANYLFADYAQSGSIPLSFETVYEYAQEADIWLIRYNGEKDKSYFTLFQENENFGRFRAFQKRKIYGCNTAYSPFYEEVPFHPERLLCNLIGIFHPEVLESEDSLYSYYQQLREFFD